LSKVILNKLEALNSIFKKIFKKNKHINDYRIVFKTIIGDFELGPIPIPNNIIKFLKIIKI
jgi:hypothetical protein